MEMCRTIRIKGNTRANTRATQTARATQRQHQHKGNARATRQHLMFLIENGQAIHSDHAFWGYGDVQNNLNQGQHTGATQTEMATQRQHQHKGNARATRAIFDVYVHQTARRCNNVSTAAVTRKVCIFKLHCCSIATKHFGDMEM